MRKATLSVLQFLLLATGSALLVPISTAAAQTETEGETEGETVESAAASTQDEADSGDELDAPTTPARREEDEQDAEDADEDDVRPESTIPWRNTYLSWTNAVTFNSFLRDAQPSYNPLFVTSLTLSPRWYLLPESYFYLSQILEVEVTDTDENVFNREPQLSDTILEFRQVVPWEGFQFVGNIRLGFPLSKASQAAQRYFQTGFGLSVVRPIPEAYLTISASFAYRIWFAGSNVVHVGEPQPDSCPRAPLPSTPEGSALPEINTATCDQLGSTSSGRDNITGGLNLAFAYEDLSITASFAMLATQGYELAPAYVQVDTSPEPVLVADGSPTHWRNYTYFSLSVGYQFLPWLNLSLGIQNAGTWASAYNADGSVRNPIFTPDTQVYLNASFQLDVIYTELTGEGRVEPNPQERQRRRQGLASRRRGGSL